MEKEDKLVWIGCQNLVKIEVRISVLGFLSLSIVSFFVHNFMKATNLEVSCLNKDANGLNRHD